jgi:hypothetical protein
MDNMKVVKVIDLLTSIDKTLKLMVGPITSIDKKLGEAAADTTVHVVSATSTPEEQLTRLKNIKKMFEEDGVLYETITRDNMLDQHAEKIQELGEKKDTLFEGMEGMLERLNTVKDILDTFSEVTEESPLGDSSDDVETPKE